MFLKKRLIYNSSTRDVDVDVVVYYGMKSYHLKNKTLNKVTKRKKLN